MASRSLGGCVTAGLAWWLIPTYPINGWRYLVIATAIPCLIPCAFRLIFYVESPRFQITKNRPAAAWKTFSLMARINCISLSNLIDKEEFMYHSKTNQKSTSHLNDFAKIFGRHHVVHTLALVILYSTVYTSYMGLTIFLPGLLQSLKVNPFSGAVIGLTSSDSWSSIITEWHVKTHQTFLTSSLTLCSVSTHFLFLELLLSSILSPCILYTVPF